MADRHLRPRALATVTRTGLSNAQPYPPCLPAPFVAILRDVRTRGSEFYRFLKSRSRRPPLWPPPPRG
jgi:hypothetical protein